jgi:hypothetical protein
MKTILLLSLFISSFARASIFTAEEVEALAKAGQSSIARNTRAHIEAHKKTGIGLMYGWKSGYSPVRPGASDENPLWTDAQRRAYIKSKLKPAFKQSLGSDAAINEWVRNAVGVQESRPRSGAIQMTSCIIWVMRNVEAAYNAAGKSQRWKEIRGILKNDPSGSDRGIVLAHELQKDGWEAVYFNPDTRNPDDDSVKRSWHTVSAANAKKNGYYYPSWYSSPEKAPANEKIKIDHFITDYRPSEGSSTPQNLSGIETLKNIPFWVGIANFGEHSFVGFKDNLSESHSPFRPEARENLELGKFQPWGKAWNRQHGGDSYMSGLIMIPPGAWQD